MKGKLEPGAICIVIGDHRGFEDNIGAMLTLVELQTCAHGHKSWTFEDASRPIAVGLGIFTRRPMVWASASNEVAPDVCGALPGFLPQWLMPIKGEDLGDESEDEAPDEQKEEELVGLPGFGRTWP